MAVMFANYVPTLFISLRSFNILGGSLIARLKFPKHNLTGVDLQILISTRDMVVNFSF